MFNRKNTKTKPRAQIHEPVQIKITARANGTRRVSQSFRDIEPLVEKSDMPLTSIRNLLKRGVDVYENADDQQYIDLTQFGDYQEQMERVAAAHDSFESLPAKLRERFKNDPAEMIDFVQNPDNHDECIRLGLLNKPNNSGTNPNPKNHNTADNTDNSDDLRDRPNSSSPKKTSKKTVEDDL